MMIGEAINLLAKENKITKYRIAKNSNLSQTIMSEISTGKNSNPTLDTLDKIATGLGITVSELIKKSEELERRNNE